MTAISAEKVQAYNETEYLVDGHPAVRLNIGVANRELAHLYELGGLGSCAFVTSCNPSGTNMSDAANQQRLADLRGQLQRRRLPFFEGAGRHPTNGWPAEPIWLPARINYWDGIAALVRRKGAWIVGRMRGFEDMLPPQSPREFVSGESFLYLGRQHRLRVERVAGARATAVALQQGRLIVRVPAKLGVRLATGARCRSRRDSSTTCLRTSSCTSSIAGTPRTSGRGSARWCTTRTHGGRRCGEPGHE